MKIMPLFIMVMPGMMSRVLYPSKDTFVLNIQESNGKYKTQVKGKENVLLHKSMPDLS